MKFLIITALFLFATAGNVAMAEVTNCTVNGMDVVIDTENAIVTGIGGSGHVAKATVIKATAVDLRNLADIIHYANKPEPIDISSARIGNDIVDLDAHGGFVSMLINGTNSVYLADSDIRFTALKMVCQ